MNEQRGSERDPLIGDNKQSSMHSHAEHGNEQNRTTLTPPNLFAPTLSLLALAALCSALTRSPGAGLLMLMADIGILILTSLVFLKRWLYPQGKQSRRLDQGLLLLAGLTFLGMVVTVFVPPVSAYLTKLPFLSTITQAATGFSPLLLPLIKLGFFAGLMALSTRSLVRDLLNKDSAPKSLLLLVNILSFSVAVEAVLKLFKLSAPLVPAISLVTVFFAAVASIAIWWLIGRYRKEREAEEVRGTETLAQQQAQAEQMRAEISQAIQAILPIQERLEKALNIEQHPSPPNEAPSLFKEVKTLHARINRVGRAINDLHRFKARTCWQDRRSMERPLTPNVQQILETYDAANKKFRIYTDILHNDLSALHTYANQVKEYAKQAEALLQAAETAEAALIAEAAAQIDGMLDEIEQTLAADEKGESKEEAAAGSIDPAEKRLQRLQRAATQVANIATEKATALEARYVTRDGQDVKKMLNAERRKIIQELSTPASEWKKDICDELLPSVKEAATAAKNAAVNAKDAARDWWQLVLKAHSEDQQQQSVGTLIVGLRQPAKDITSTAGCKEFAESIRGVSWNNLPLTLAETLLKTLKEGIRAATEKLAAEKAAAEKVPPLVEAAKAAVAKRDELAATPDAQAAEEAGVAKVAAEKAAQAAERMEAAEKRAAERVAAEKEAAGRRAARQKAEEEAEKERKAINAVAAVIMKAITEVINIPEQPATNESFWELKDGEMGNWQQEIIRRMPENLDPSATAQARKYMQTLIFNYAEAEIYEEATAPRARRLLTCLRGLNSQDETIRAAAENFYTVMAGEVLKQVKQNLGAAPAAARERSGSSGAAEAGAVGMFNIRAATEEVIKHSGLTSRYKKQ